MAKRVVATGFGGPENLSVVEYDPGTPGPGEVLLEVRAAGVNPIDLKLYSGAFGADPARLPLPLGFEVAGVVAAVGEGAPWGVGDEVIGYRVDGGYADQLLAPVDSLVAKPAALSWEVAAGLLLAGVTAAHAVQATGVGPGDVVLVHAASGGVGLIAVQLAVARGARVIGTASVRRHELLRELGAEPVAYGDGLLERVRELAPDGIDSAVDAIGGDEPIDVSLALLHDRNRFATIVASPRAAELGLKRLGGGPGADLGAEIRSAARSGLVASATDGSLKVFVTQAFPLAEAGAAHRLVGTTSGGGKVVLVP